MKIGLILPCLSVGGAEQVVLDLAIEYTKSHHDVEVIGFASGGNMAPRFQEKGISVVVLNLARNFRLSSSWCNSVRLAHNILFNHLQNRNFDVIHTHLLGADIDGIFAARRAGVPVVVHTIHNTYPQFCGQSFYDKVKNLSRKLMWSRYDRLFAVDNEVRDWVIQCGMANSKKLTVVTNGINTDHLEVIEPRDKIRETLGWNKNEIILLNVASLTTQKNQKSLLEALTLIKDHSKQLHLVLAGGGPNEITLKEQAKQICNDIKVSFLGVRKDVPTLIKAADIFVFPSLWEGLPIALLEALASGIPVIISDLPVHKKLTENGATGFLCSPTPVGIADAISLIITNLDNEKNKANIYKDKIRSKYCSSRMASEYLIHYETIYQKAKKA